jgi:hypothetical protein
MLQLQEDVSAAGRLKKASKEKNNKRFGQIKRKAHKRPLPTYKDCQDERLDGFPNGFFLGKPYGSTSIRPGNAWPTVTELRELERIERRKAKKEGRKPRKVGTLHQYDRGEDAGNKII